MNPEGWISIPLLASFNRIRQLAPDSQLVREVLSLSLTAEVSEDWVRMGGNKWAPFVLPPPTGSTPQEDVEEGESVEVEDDDDVEFIMSQEDGNQRWMSPRRPS